MTSHVHSVTAFMIASEQPLCRSDLSTGFSAGFYGFLPDDAKSPFIALCPET